MTAQEYQRDVPKEVLLEEIIKDIEGFYVAGNISCVEIIPGDRNVDLYLLESELHAKDIYCYRLEMPIDRVFSWNTERVYSINLRGTKINFLQ
jgi:hypothetical protein